MSILPKDVQVLGALDTVGTSSRFQIHPFVGSITYPYTFRVSEVEIAEVLEIPISFLLYTANQREEVRLKDAQLSKTYSYVYKGHIIHGATARILTQFLIMIKQP